ncbi:hypothetical protein CAL7716_107730 (plasmid) [Calothrix sp. PCC 7716]|nr:hypothetical protein CAL7716_107730 [Calothrix sp. PCC 7716]
MTTTIDVDKLARKIINTVSTHRDNNKATADASTMLADMRVKLGDACAAAQSINNKIRLIIHHNNFGTFPNTIARQSRELLQVQQSLIQNMRNYCDRNVVLSANLSDENVKDSFLKNVDAFGKIHEKVKTVLSSLAAIVSKYN